LSWVVHAFAAITRLGNLAVLFPLGAVMLAWQLNLRQRGAAISWLAAFAICVGAIALFKIVFFSCPPIRDLRNPSGHAGLSTLVYGGFVAVIVANLQGWRRWGGIALGAALVAAIAMSRVVLRNHTVPEVLFGLAIGTGCLIFFCAKYLPHRVASVPFWGFSLSLAVIVVLLYGYTVHAEEFLHRLSGYLGAWHLSCR
jgi:membrane-associated phospholipid phosphatase